MTTTRLRLVALIAGIAALVLSVAPGTASARWQVGLPAQVAAPVFSFPSNGASYPANGPYLFQVQPISGAKGYLWSFVQNGMIVYQNLAWDGHLSPASYAVSARSQAHRLIRAGDLHVWVRALMKNGHWSGTGEVMVRIQGKRGNPVSHPKATPSPAPQPTATPERPAPGTVLYKADTSGGLDQIQGGASWKHVDGLLVNDGSAQSLITLPYKPVLRDYAVEADIQIVTVPTDWSDKGFGVAGRITADDRYGYWAGVWAGGLILDGGNIPQVYPDVGFQVGSGAGFSPDTNYHTYRLEVRGNQYRALFDGSPVSQGVDNPYLDSGQAAVWDNQVQLNIRAIRVIAL